jgi:hypothetical protein
MAAFMNDEVYVIKNEESGMVQVSVEKKESIETEPSDSCDARDGLPFAQLVFEEGHFD